MRSLVLVVALGGCLKTTVVTCNDGNVCPSGEACDEVHKSCVAPDQLTTCVGMADGLSCTIRKTDAGLCRDAVCLAVGCGDGFKRGDEKCDGADLGGMTCEGLGFYDTSPLACNQACAFDTSACLGFCGDGMVNGPEICDGAPPQLSCVDLGFGAGFLDCNQCAPTTEDCRLEGWTSYPTHDPMTGVHGTSDSDIYAVGQQTILHFNGSSWAPVDVGGCITATTNVEAVFSFGAGEAVVVGADVAGGLAFRLTPNGCTRSMVDVVGGLPTGVWASGPNDIYAVDANGIFHFDGSGWSSAKAATGLSRVWGSGAADVYAGGKTALYHFDGATWTPITVPGVSQVLAIWGTSASDVYVGGSSKPNMYIGVVAHFDGSTWTTLVTDLFSEVGAGTASAGHVFADISSSISVLDGPAWTDLQSPATPVHTRSMWSSATGRVISVGATAEVLTFSGVEQVTDSAIGSPREISVRGRAATAAINNAVYDLNGTSWYQDTTTNVPTPPVSDVWIAPTGELLALQAFGGLSKRAAGVWTTVAAVNGSALWGNTASDVWVANQNQLRHVVGSVISCLSCDVAGPVYDLWGSSASDLFAVGDMGLVLHGDGVTWTPMTVPTSTTLTRVGGTGPDDVYALGVAGAVIHYDGHTWTSIEVGSGEAFDTIFAIARDDVFIAGQHGILYHFDGAHWAPVRTLTQYSIDAIGAVGDSLFQFDDLGRAFRLITTAKL